MASFLPYCNPDVPDYQCDNCIDEEEGQVRHIAAIINNVPIDWESYSAIMTAESNGDIIIARNIRGDKPKATANKGNGWGDALSTTMNHTDTLNIEDHFVCANADFWGALNRRNNVRLAFFTQKTIFVTVNTASFDVTPEISADKKTSAVFKGTAEWIIPKSYGGQNLCYNRPDGNFETCPN